MKKLLLLLTFPAVSVASELEHFKINEVDYRMVPQTIIEQVSDKTIFISALWEVTGRKDSYRWKVITSGCDKPIGSVTIISESMVKTFDWSWQGNRAYDHMAAAACIANLLPVKK